MQNNNKIKIYTDGACKGNPGIGGWGVYVLGKNDETDLNGFDINTTNNKMELTAVIEGLKTLQNKAEVTIFTDSQYVKNGISQWIYKWKKNGWKTASKKPVKNVELWKKLKDLSSKHSIKWIWVKGHAQNKYNNIVDELAQGAIKR